MLQPGKYSSDYKKFSIRGLFPGQFHLGLLTIKYKTYLFIGLKSTVSE